jgi:hypothetical protein
MMLDKSWREETKYESRELEKRLELRFFKMLLPAVGIVFFATLVWVLFVLFGFFIITIVVLQFIRERLAIRLAGGVSR